MMGDFGLVLLALLLVGLSVADSRRARLAHAFLLEPFVRLRRYAEEAGYERVEMLPIENDLCRFYRLFTK
jgi:hypothetical protein